MCVRTRNTRSPCSEYRHRFGAENVPTTDDLRTPIPAFPSVAPIDVNTKPLHPGVDEHSAPAAVGVVCDGHGSAAMSVCIPVSRSVPACRV